MDGRDHQGGRLAAEVGSICATGRPGRGRLRLGGRIEAGMPPPGAASLDADFRRHGVRGAPAILREKNRAGQPERALPGRTLSRAVHPTSRIQHLLRSSASLRLLSRCESLSGQVNAPCPDVQRLAAIFGLNASTPTQIGATMLNADDPIARIFFGLDHRKTRSLCWHGFRVLKIADGRVKVTPNFTRKG